MRTDNNTFSGMEALAETRMEFIEWLCEKHGLNFAEEQEEFEAFQQECDQIEERQKHELQKYGKDVHMSFWGLHYDGTIHEENMKKMFEWVRELNDKDEQGK